MPNVQATACCNKSHPSMTASGGRAVRSLQRMNLPTRNRLMLGKTCNGALILQEVTGDLLRDRDREAERLMTALSQIATPCPFFTSYASLHRLNVLLMPVQGVSKELLRDIDREATRRMTALVAPQASEAHGPAMLRLSMGPLFEEVSLLPSQYSLLGERP